METDITTGQMKAFLALCEQKKVTPDTFQALRKSGILSDVLDPAANLKNRTKIRRALGMFEETKFVSAIFRGLPHDFTGCIIEIEEDLLLSQLSDYLQSNGYVPLVMPETQHLRDLAKALMSHANGDCGIALIPEVSSREVSTMLLCHAVGYRSGTTSNAAVLKAGIRLFVTTSEKK